MSQADGVVDHMASLEDHWQTLEVERLVVHVQLAMFAAACHRGSLELDSELAAEVTTITLALCQVYSNQVAVTNLRVSSAKDRRGQAMYPVLSMLNHSCRPNVGLTFEVRLMGATAVVPMQEVIFLISHRILMVNFFLRMWAGPILCVHKQYSAFCSTTRIRKQVSVDWPY